MIYCALFLVVIVACFCSIDGQCFGRLSQLGTADDSSIRIILPCTPHPLPPTVSAYGVSVLQCGGCGLDVATVVGYDTCETTLRP